MLRSYSDFDCLSADESTFSNVSSVLFDSPQNSITRYSVPYIVSKLYHDFKSGASLTNCTQMIMK